MNRVSSVVLGLGILLAACGGGGEEAPDASLVPDAMPPTGSVSLTWSIEQGGVASDCAAVGAAFVVLELVPEGAGAGVADPLNCTAGAATSRPLAVGTYNVTIDLVNSSAESLLDAPLTQTGVEVNADSDTPLGEIVFEL